VADRDGHVTLDVSGVQRSVEGDTLVVGDERV
jgi:hypothetical protein